MIPQGPSVDLTSEAGRISSIWNLFMWLAIGVLALVIVLVVYVVVRFRRRDTLLAKQTHYRPVIEITYVVIPLILVVGLFFVTLSGLREVDTTHDEPDEVIDVVGFQWDWQFGYPDEGVTVTGDEAGDPPELVLPADSKVRFNLTSRDVIHSFWIPEFHFKRDLIPGSPTSFDVTVSDEVGTYRSGACAEFCGLDHARMIFDVRVVDRAEFDRWIDQQRKEGP